MDYFRRLLEEALLMEGVATVSAVNDAIDNLQQVEIRYNSGGEPVATGRRIIYPVAYGLTKSGNPVVRAFEPYGDTKTKVPAWKFFRLDRIKKWRTLDKTFKGQELNGFNENGDETMSIVYNIANIKGRPQNIKFPPIGSEPVTKSDISPKEKEKEVDTALKQGEKYGSEDIVKDLIKHVPQDGDPLSGIKAQVDSPVKSMVSPEIMKQIEKDNARRKLAMAKKQGKTLDNERELLNIIKGNTADRTNAPKTVPITKDKIVNGQQDGDPLSGIRGQVNSPVKRMVSPDMLRRIEKDNARRRSAMTKRNRGIVPAGNSPVMKSQIDGNSTGKTYELSNDDIEAIRREWGLS